MCKAFDLGSGAAESHRGAMKIVAEYEKRESEVEVLGKRSSHGTSTERAFTRGGNGCGCVARYRPRVLSFVGVAIE